LVEAAQGDDARRCLDLIVHGVDVAQERQIPGHLDRSEPSCLDGAAQRVLEDGACHPFVDCDSHGQAIEEGLHGDAHHEHSPSQSRAVPANRQMASLPHGPTPSAVDDLGVNDVGVVGGVGWG